MLKLEKSDNCMDTLVEFLEVAFHSILFLRKLYPKSIFCLKKKYQIPIHISKYPEINNYILECLKTAKELLYHNSLKRIVLIIEKEEGIPVEKYSFDLIGSGSNDEDKYFVETEEGFREYLLKLYVSELKELPEQCTFRIEITTTKKCCVLLNENNQNSDFPWVEAETKNNVEEDFKILPLKTLSTSLVKLNMYLER